MGCKAAPATSAVQLPFAGLEGQPADGLWQVSSAGLASAALLGLGCHLRRPRHPGPSNGAHHHIASANKCECEWRSADKCECEWRSSKPVGLTFRMRRKISDGSVAVGTPSTTALLPAAVEEEDGPS